MGWVGGGALVFFYATFFMPPRKKSKIFMPPRFMPPLKFLCHLFYATPQFWKCLCQISLCHLDYLCVSKRQPNSQRYIDFFSTLFDDPKFFYDSPFYATLKKIEIFMPPPFYATLKILMPPFLCHPGGGIKKRGDGIKKNQCPRGVWNGGSHSKVSTPFPPV